MSIVFDTIGPPYFALLGDSADDFERYEVNSLTGAVVPLPAALPLFATGLGVVVWLSRRRKRKAETLAVEAAARV